jgi:hypothetical protein
MTPERFQQIEELHHAAREGTPKERAVLLAQIDPELRGEVELLLSQSSGGEFLARPAVAYAPELLEDRTVTGLAAGFFLGPYRIESKLGEGGMGECFGRLIRVWAASSLSRPRRSSLTSASSARRAPLPC